MEEVDNFLSGFSQNKQNDEGKCVDLIKYRSSLSFREDQSL